MNLLSKNCVNFEKLNRGISYHLAPMKRPDEKRPSVAGSDTVEPPFPILMRGPVIIGFGRGSKELGVPTANLAISHLETSGNSQLPNGVYFAYVGLDFFSEPSPIPSNLLVTSSNSTNQKTHVVNTTDISNSHTSPNFIFQTQSKETSPSPKSELSSNDDTLRKSSLLPSKSSPYGKVFEAVLSIGWNPFYKNERRSIEVHVLNKFPEDFYGRHLSVLILGYIRPEYDYDSLESLVSDIHEDIRVAQRSLRRKAYLDYQFDQRLLSFDQDRSTVSSENSIGITIPSKPVSDSTHNEAETKNSPDHR